jgi:hypothetical protein
VIKWCFRAARICKVENLGKCEPIVVAHNLHALFRIGDIYEVRDASLKMG